MDMRLLGLRVGVKEVLVMHFIICVHCRHGTLVEGVNILSGSQAYSLFVYGIELHSAGRGEYIIVLLAINVGLRLVLFVQLNLNELYNVEMGPSGHLIYVRLLVQIH